MAGMKLEDLPDRAVQGRHALKVSGGVTIDGASVLREALLGALSAASDLQVDLAGVTGIDLTGLQLLCAAHHSAELSGKRFHISDGGNRVFCKVVAESGFLRRVGCVHDCSNSCIWAEGGKPMPMPAASGVSA